MSSRNRWWSLTLALLVTTALPISWPASGQETAPTPTSDATRLVSFGTREYYARPGRGIYRRYLEVGAETRSEYGRKIEIKEFKDQVVSSQDAYSHFITTAEVEFIGEQMSYKIKPMAVRTVTVTFDGKSVGHLNEGIGPPTSPAMPTSMEDPVLLEESLMVSWQLVVDRWMARRKANPPKDAEGNPLHPLSGLEFEAIIPRPMKTGNFSFTRVADEALTIRGQSVATTRFAVTKTDTDRSGGASIEPTTWTFWITADGDIVRVVQSFQRSYQGERETYNLKYYPGFAGTITEDVDLVSEGSQVRRAFFATSRYEEAFGLEGKDSRPAVLVLHDEPTTRRKKIVPRTFLEMARTGLRVMVLQTEGAVSVDGVDPLADRKLANKALESLRQKPGVDADQVYLLTVGGATSLGASLLADGKFKGWIVVNGFTGAASDLAAAAQTPLPMLVVYGTGGEEDGAGARQACADEIQKIMGGQAEVLALPNVDISLRIDTDDIEVKEELAPGYLVTVGRWFQRQLHR